MDDCKAILSDDTLVVQTGRIRRTYAWNRGHLISRRIDDLSGDRVWDLKGETPDCEIPGAGELRGDGRLAVVEQPQTTRAPAHVQADVECRLGDLEVRRSFRLYRDCPAIACDYYLRGSMNAVEAGSAPVIERLLLGERHVRLKCAGFFDATDGRNNLVVERTILPYVSPTPLSGNVLVVEDLLSDRGLFVLKEAPCSDMQLAPPACDFLCAIGDIRLLGMGAEPDEVGRQEWTRCYGFVTGVAGADKRDLLKALRTYQANVRTQRGRRDHMIMLNTWGDRGGDGKVCEAFAMAELEAGARLGVTHLQLDHGWEACRGGDMTLSPGLLADIWGHPGFWHVHPERFPDGLGPVVKRAEELGIELCLWFVPSSANGYAHWRDDADVLIGFHREHGLRTFKIDSVELPTRRADTNLRAMMDRVMDATGGEAVFNLDATAGRRFGYHYLNQYGNIFVENRYTDWANYHPHWSLRNLWSLSRYVPPQSLQIEFLNKWRNADAYGDDPLSPARVPFDYCFAVTMMAQPLAWFEASGLPEEAFEIAPLVRAYVEHQERVHAGHTFPIGEEPCGTGWTGFQSCRDDGGYFLVFRELNDRPSAALDTWDLAGRSIECKLVAGHGRDFTTQVADNGLVEFSLPGPFTFALYEYRML